MKLLLDILAVGGGGALGSVLRFLISLGTERLQCSPLLGTLTANVLGSALIGISIARLSGRPALLVAVGICGGFTTFSTFSAQTLALMQQGQWCAALGYAALSLISCLGALALVLALCK